MKLILDFNKGEFHSKVDMELPEQGVTAIFGPSGCGKTSLLRVVAGLDKFENNRINFSEVDWQTQDSFIATHKRSIAYVFQEASLFTHLDVAGNLDFAAKRVPSGTNKVSYQQVVELLGLETMLKRKSTDLSGGERKRVAIARALISSPKLLLMDEPLTGLDQKSKREIMHYIQCCQQEMAIPILYVSHAIDEVSQLADYLLLMNAGSVVRHGPIQSMLTQLDSQLALDDSAGAIVNASKVEYETEFNLSRLETEIGGVSIVGKVSSNIQNLRLRLAARDISITLHAQKDTSILNIFPSVIDQIKEIDDGLVIVRLKIKDVAVLARITKKSAHDLALSEGQKVFAQVKSVALL